MTAAPPPDPDGPVPPATGAGDGVPGAAAEADAPTPGGVRLVPVQTDTGRIVRFGTAVFALAAVVLLVLRASAPDWSADHPAWLWTAVAGAGLGLIGLVLVGRHRRLGRTK